MKTLPILATAFLLALSSLTAAASPEEARRCVPTQANPNEIVVEVNGVGILTTRVVDTYIKPRKGFGARGIIINSDLMAQILKANKEAFAALGQQGRGTKAYMSFGGNTKTLVRSKKLPAGILTVGGCPQTETMTVWARRKMQPNMGPMVFEKTLLGSNVPRVTIGW